MEYMTVIGYLYSQAQAHVQCTNIHPQTNKHKHTNAHLYILTKSFWFRPQVIMRLEYGGMSWEVFHLWRIRAKLCNLQKHKNKKRCWVLLSRNFYKKLQQQITEVRLFGRNCQNLHKILTLSQFYQRYHLGPIIYTPLTCPFPALGRCS